MAPSGRRRRTTTKSTRPAAETTTRPRRTQYKKQQVKQPKKDVQKAATMEDLLPMSATSSTTTSDDHRRRHHHHDGGSSSSLGFDNQQSAVDHDPQSFASSSGCSTPKAKKFRIPKIETCPPAPKKKRVVSNCSLQRGPIAFFAPPDLELFFFHALRDISV